MASRCTPDIWSPKSYYRVSRTTRLRLRGYWRPVILQNTYAGYASLSPFYILACFIVRSHFQAKTRFSEEESRAHQYLSLQTSAPLQTILQNTLLAPHLQRLIDMPNSGLNTMIDHERLDDLSRLNHLYSIVGEGIPCLRRSLKDSVQKRGTELSGITAEERQLGDGGADDEL